MNILYVGSIVVFACLPNRIRRIAHDDAHIQFLEALSPIRVVSEEVADEIGFLQAEGVGEADALEGLVFPADDAVIDGFDVDGGDIVGEEDDLVGVDLVFVFVRELFLGDEAALDEAGDEGAGAGEGIDDVDALAAEGLAELLFQQVIHGMDDEVHDLHGGIDDAEPLGHAGEGVTEELVVKLDDDFLFSLGGVGVLRLAGDAGVEFLQGVRFLFQTMLLEDIERVLHGLGDGVVASEGVVREEGVEDGLGNEVLGEHLDDFGIGDGVVKIVA